MSRNAAPPSFDRVAGIYRWAEYAALGPLLQKTRTHWLPLLTHCNQAIAFGDGDGRFLEQLLFASPHCRALAVDSSAKMLERLRHRCLTHPSAAGRLTTLHANALEVAPPPNIDLVITHFFLDCLTQREVDDLVTRITPQLAPGALWLVSDFALPQRSLLRPIARLYIRSLYAAFRLLTGLRVRRLPNPQRTLQAAGFRMQHRWHLLNGLLYTELWQRE